MTLIMPTVPAVIAVVDDNLADVVKMAEAPFLDSNGIVPFVTNNSKFMMKPIHDNDKKFIRNEGGKISFFMMWAHPVQQLSNDPDFMIAIEFRRSEPNAKGDVFFAPEAVLRGTAANVLIFGGMNCCGALQGHWTQLRDDGTVIDRALMPAAGIIKDDHNEWLKEKIFVADNNDARGQLAHLYMDMLNHRFPGQGFGHDCSSQAAYGDMKGVAKPLSSPAPR